MAHHYGTVPGLLPLTRSTKYAATIAGGKAIKHGKRENKRNVLNDEIQVMYEYRDIVSC